MNVPRPVVALPSQEDEAASPQLAHRRTLPPKVTFIKGRRRQGRLYTYSTVHPPATCPRILSTDFGPRPRALLEIGHQVALSILKTFEHVGQGLLDLGLLFHELLELQLAF